MSSHGKSRPLVHVQNKQQRQSSYRKDRTTNHLKGDFRMIREAIRPFTKITFFAGAPASRVEAPVYLERKKPSRKGLLLAFLSVLLFSVTQQSNAQTVCNNQTGSNNGFFYSFWKDTGSACMTLGSGGNYDVNWNL